MTLTSKPFLATGRWTFYNEKETHKHASSRHHQQFSNHQLF